jgi:hypothetical protein
VGGRAGRARHAHPHRSLRRRAHADRLLVGWWYQRQQVRSGVGPGRGSGAVTGAVVLLALLLVPVLWLSPFPAVAAGLLGVAVLPRNPYLALWAVVFGVLGVLLLVALHREDRAR